MSKNGVEPPFPTMKEELERKVIEQIESLALMKDRGDINDHSFRACLNSIYHTTSGLIDWNISDAISAEMNVIRKPDGSESDNRAFVKGSACIFIQREYGRWSVLVSGLNGAESLYDFSEEIHPVKAAKDKQNELNEKLISAGWERRI